MSRIRTSEVLKQIEENLGEEDITVEGFVNKLGERSFGIGILLFALPNVIPLGIPIISSISAIPIMIFALQMVFGFEKIKLPASFAKRKFREKLFEKVIKTILPVLKALEVVIKPRADIFVSDTFEKILGVVIFILGFILFLPIPLANAAPAFCIAVISLGILERDGVVVVTGVIISAITVSGLTALIYKTVSFAAKWMMS